MGVVLFGCAVKISNVLDIGQLNFNIFYMLQLVFQHDCQHLEQSVLRNNQAGGYAGTQSNKLFAIQRKSGKINYPL